MIKNEILKVVLLLNYYSCMPFRNTPTNELNILNGVTATTNELNVLDVGTGENVGIEESYVRRRPLPDCRH